MRQIVDSNTMRLLEEKAVQSGTSIETLMDLVAKQIADHICTLTKKILPTPPILFLCGRGNNGADAYTTGSFLLKKSFPCFAMQVGECTEHSLLESRKKMFLHNGGKMVTYETLKTLPSSLIIVDGIYGVGFRGSLNAAAAKAILFANAHPGLLISIDIPSGIDPSTGVVNSEAIFADYTIACHYPKKGCFLNAGFEHTGKILYADLPIQTLNTDMTVLEHIDLFSLLPRLKRSIDKFQAGVVFGISGSSGMLGASALASSGAYAVGAGYVRLFLPKNVENEYASLPVEAIKTIRPEQANEMKHWFKQPASVFVGPGLGRENKTLRFLDELFDYLPQETVLDADGLYFLSTKPLSSWKVQGKILTPHRYEAEKLFHASFQTITESTLQALHNIAATKDVVIVLKGSPTYIINSIHPTIIMPFGNPGMATAGSGDVATGMIAGFRAKNLSPLSAAILGTSLHGIAGEEAAFLHTSYAMTASSLIPAISRAIQKIMDHGTTHAPRSYLPYGRCS